jgi:hypothetical protein
MGKRVILLFFSALGMLLLAAPMAAANSVTSVEPHHAYDGQTVSVTVYGDFRHPTDIHTLMPSFSLVNGGTTIDATSVSILESTGEKAYMTFAIPVGAALGAYVLNSTQGYFNWVPLPWPLTGIWVGPLFDVVSLPAAFTVEKQPPVITSLSPPSVLAGSGEQTLVVHGNYFEDSNIFFTGSSVRWNGAALETTFNSATQVTAIVPAAKLTTAGTAAVTVMNVTDGTTSEAAAFTIGAQVPVLTSLSPTSVWAGYVKDDVVLTVNGGNFLDGAHIFLSGGEMPGTSFVNAARLTPTTLTVSVKNPPIPPGTSSALALLLPVLAETTDPAVTISGADSGWHNTSVALTFSAADSQSGVQKVQYQSPPTVAAWTDGTSYTVPVTTQGAIAVSAQALDWCNRVGTASATVNIDTTKPDTDALNAVSVKKGKNAKLKFRISEPVGLSPGAQVVIKIKSAKGGNTVKTITIPSAPVNSNQTYSFKCTLKKGAYKWYIYATDLAGNTQANVDKASFTVK